MGFARHFFLRKPPEEMNSTWHPEIEEPIKSREKHYSLVLYILIMKILVPFTPVYPDIFENGPFFFFEYGYRPHVAGVSGIRVYRWTVKCDLKTLHGRCIFLNLEKKKYVLENSLVRGTRSICQISAVAPRHTLTSFNTSNFPADN